MFQRYFLNMVSLLPAWTSGNQRRLDFRLLSMTSKRLSAFCEQKLHNTDTSRAASLSLVHPPEATLLHPLPHPIEKLAATEPLRGATTHTPTPTTSSPT